MNTLFRWILKSAAICMRCAYTRVTNAGHTCLPHYMSAFAPLHENHVIDD